MTLVALGPPLLAPWLLYTLLAVVLWGIWGIVSKMAEKTLKPSAIQVISTVGVVSTSLLFLLSPGVKEGTNFRIGCLAAFGVRLTASVGNLAFLLSLKHGGKSSTVL